MIRRDVRLTDSARPNNGAAAWMLISQIEHARVSAELASCCTGRFGVTAERAVREEVLAAILHHDDGWAEWERAPQLDAAGRPLGFTELATADALAIWSRSIDAAATVGPLAAWMVAGHFLRLARHSESAQNDREFQTWQSQFEKRRKEWLVDWQNANSVQHTRAVADEALQWLWTFDEVSLWLCCSCTLAEPIPCSPEPYLAGRGAPVEMELTAVGPEMAVIRPWRFDRERVELTIEGRQLPAERYRNSAEMQAIGAPWALQWRLAREK